MITMSIAIIINLSSGTMVIKTKGSKSLNKRKALTYYLASIKVAGLLCVRRRKTGDRKIVGINIGLFESDDRIQNFFDLKRSIS